MKIHPKFAQEKFKQASNLKWYYFKSPTCLINQQSLDAFVVKIMCDEHKKDAFPLRITVFKRV